MKPRNSLIDWGMMFSELYFEEKNEKLNYQNRVQVIFEIDIDYIISTKNFFNHLIKNVFKTYFEQNICYINEKEISKGNYIIICNKTFDKNLLIIFLIFIYIIKR